MGNSNSFMGIGETIKALREEKGLTQAELAKRLNVKRETVNQWENNARDLKTQYTISLAKEFGVSADYILGITPGVKTTDTTIKGICDYTGLSENALNGIVSMKQFKYYFPCLIKLLECDALRLIVSIINDYLHDKNEFYKEGVKQRKLIRRHIKEELLNNSEYDWFEDYAYNDLITNESLCEETINFQEWKFQQNLIKIANAFIDDNIEKPKELEQSFYDFIKECNPRAFDYQDDMDIMSFNGNKKSILEEEANGKHTGEAE